MTLEDELDLELLNLLSLDGRKSFRSLAEELGKSPATIKKHIEEMEERV
ncbi:MAG: winged helix-turn-helix domain-containing protein [Promethearchaeota archaeon]